MSSNNTYRQEFIPKFYSYSNFFFDVQQYCEQYSDCAFYSAYDIILHGQRTTLLLMWEEHCAKYADLQAEYFVDEVRLYVAMLSGVN